MLLRPGETSDPRLYRITLDDEVVGLRRVLALNHAIQAGEAELIDLPALRFNGIGDRAMAEFLGQEILRARSDSGFDILSRKAERLASAVYTPQRDMGMRMFGVVVDDRYPFEIGLKVPFHPSHQFPCVILKVDSVPELGRDDDFEEPLIAGFLPLVESLRNINTPLGTAETGRLLLPLLGRPLACQVVAVCSPLASVLVPRVGHPHGTPLAPWRPAASGVPSTRTRTHLLPVAAHAHESQKGSQAARPRDVSVDQRRMAGDEAATETVVLCR